MAKEPHPAWLGAVSEASPEIARLATWGANNMTALEKKFWGIIGRDGNPWGLIPQFPVIGYVLDFYAPYAKVAIELDGPHHQGRKAEDLKRDKKLAKSEKILVIRFTRADLLKIGKKGIYDYLEGVFENVERPKQPPPPPPAPVVARKPDPPPPSKPGPNDTPFD
jgi:very-short-patch-repair endonuclease